MRLRFLGTFVFHLISVSLVLFPKQLKGPVLTVVNDMIPITVLDVVAAILILAGSVFLYMTLFKFLKSQTKCAASTENVAKSVEQGEVNA